MHWSLSQCRKCCVREPAAKSLSSSRAAEVLKELEPSRSRWGNWGSWWGEFLQGWSTEWPDTIGICTRRQLFWPLHPSHASPGVLPGVSSTSQPNVPDVHCCNCSIFKSCTNQKQGQRGKNGKCQNNRPGNEGWKRLVVKSHNWQALVVSDFRELTNCSRASIHCFSQ